MRGFKGDNHVRETFPSSPAKVRYSINVLSARISTVEFRVVI